jgi:transposase
MSRATNAVSEANRSHKWCRTYLAISCALKSGQKEGMRGRWELSDAKWTLIEPILRPQRRSDGRGRPWQDTRAVLNGILWVLGTGAQWRELPNKYPPYQTCHRRFQQWVRAGKLERILRMLAEELQARGKLDLEEAFIDASFTGAKKGASRSGQPSAARGRKSLLSPMITVFLSPLVSKAHRRMKANSSKGS